jgi:hypothetical protein
MVTDPDPTQWINYSQTYYKIPVAQAGLYRITPTDLQRVGVPVNQIDPTTIQLFHRGVEQAIYVEGESDRHFDSTDFLEFYGRGNDGTQDSLLYRPPFVQSHAYYSLFNDTTAYFLTWRLDGKPGKRMAAYTDTLHAGLTPEPWHWAEELRLFTDDYPGWPHGLPQKVEFSQYESGEGYTGVIQQKDKPFSQLFQLINPVRNGTEPQLDMLLVGRGFTNHRVDCFAGPTPDKSRLVDTLQFLPFDNVRSQRTLTWNDIDNIGQLTVSTVSRNPFTTTDAYSVSYIQLRYPQKLVVNGTALSVFQLPRNSNGRSLIHLTDAQPDTRLLDISDPTQPIRIGIASSLSGEARFVVRNTTTSRKILGVSRPKTVAGIRPVTFVNWSNRKPRYLIISHEALMQPVTIPASVSPVNAVQAYAAYRASEAGGSHDTLTVTMQQLIDQYGYGERTPLAIRRFARQMLQQGAGVSQYLVLLGRSRSTPGIRRNPAQATLDMVMTAGFPPSDLALTTGLNENQPDTPAMPTGRINAGTPQEVLDYLAKVKEYESQPNADWRKNLLHLSGGLASGELIEFRQLVDAYAQQATGPSLGARVTTISKTTDSPAETINVTKPVNEGVGIMTFFGHSGLDITDVDIGFCSNNALGYQNKGKYPFMLVNGCAIGNFFFGRPTLATDWVLTPNRGAIAAIAHSHLGYADLLHQYSSVFYTLLADSTWLDKSIGQLQQETVRRVVTQSTDGRAIANSQQMVLQGDPAIRLFPFQTPDYVLTTGGLTVQSADHQPLTSLSDSVQIRAIVRNVGQYRSGPLPIQVRRFANGHELGTIHLTMPHSIAFRDTLTLTFPNERGADGLNQFEVTINPTGLPSTLIETNHANNQATLELTIPTQKPALIYPALNSSISTTTVPLTASYFADGPHIFDLELDTTSRFESPFRLTKRLSATNLVSFSATLENRPNTIYFWRVRLADKPGETREWSISSFVYNPADSSPLLPEGQIRLQKPFPTDIRQGDVIQIPVQFWNLSPQPFADSLVVHQTIYAAGLSPTQTAQWRIKAPVRQDTLTVTTRIATEKLPGVNRVFLTINPRLQPEYSFLNNTLDLTLSVQPDVLGPLLEVAVDGARIAEGSVVSAQPLLDILIADDNRSLIQRDTTGLAIYLQRPGLSARFERLSWHNATILPAEMNNVFRLKYPLPKLTQGLYRLLVTAHDAVGNHAIPYQVSFQVIHKNQLSNLAIYPNPFHEQTLFSFSLTGGRAPTYVTITLTDLNGHVVRQLTQPAHIGLNEWGWDGRSESGALVPAGVYLYKLRLSDEMDWPIAGLQKLSGRVVVTR